MDIDELYLPFYLHIQGLMPIKDCIISDEEKGILTYPEQMEISMPVEMDVQVNEEDEVLIGSTPPMYYANTSLLPVFHHLKITIAKND